MVTLLLAVTDNSERLFILLMGTQRYIIITSTTTANAKRGVTIVISVGMLCDSSPSPNKDVKSKQARIKPELSVTPRFTADTDRCQVLSAKLRNMAYYRDKELELDSIEMK